jgi:hypothetical protein
MELPCDGPKIHEGVSEALCIMEGDRLNYVLHAAATLEAEHASSFEGVGRGKGPAGVRIGHGERRKGEAIDGRGERAACSLKGGE